VSVMEGLGLMELLKKRGSLESSSEGVYQERCVWSCERGKRNAENQQNNRRGGGGK